MATAFEPSASLRTPYSTAVAPSMADTLPNVNFGFDELRDRMAKFTHKFDEFIAEGRKRVLEERNQFRMNVAELHEDQKLKTRALEILTHKSQTHQQTLEKESLETSEILSSIASIKAQLSATQTQKSSLQSKISTIQSSISARLAAQATHSAALSAQSAYNNPELEFWENYLCMRIEGAGEVDKLRFVFTHVSEREWEREAWFELSTEKREYEVTSCEPKVDKEGMESCVDRLNESRDLALFLKGMRELFSEVMK